MNSGATVSETSCSGFSVTMRSPLTCLWHNEYKSKDFSTAIWVPPSFGITSMKDCWTFSKISVPRTKMGAQVCNISSFRCISSSSFWRPESKNGRVPYKPHCKRFQWTVAHICEFLPPQRLVVDTSVPASLAVLSHQSRRREFLSVVIPRYLNVVLESASQSKSIPSRSQAEGWVCPGYSGFIDGERNKAEPSLVRLVKKGQKCSVISDGEEEDSTVMTPVCDSEGSIPTSTRKARARVCDESSDSFEAISAVRQGCLVCILVHGRHGQENGWSFKRSLGCRCRTEKCREQVT